MEEEFAKRKYWFAGGAVAVAALLLPFSGFSGLAWCGLSVSIFGALDFLFIQHRPEGWIASEVYGDPGEELWQFRSFFLMIGGPLLVLYAVLFG